MARGGSRSNSRRGTIVTTTNIVPQFKTINLSLEPVTLQIDRRRYYPSPIGPKVTNPKPAGGVVRHATRLKAPPSYNGVAFARPDLVAVCARRKIRKRIMHAMGMSGARSFKFKKPQRNYWSNVKC